VGERCEISLDVTQARRLALARGGLLPRRWSGLPDVAAGAGLRARRRCHEVVDRFGYLQLDSVSVAGARSHSIVLFSRLEGVDGDLPETLLRSGEPLFEYWGHEASWLPIDLYPAFGFRRRQFRVHPWWGDLLGAHPEIVERILKRVRHEGPIRSADLEGRSRSGWWDLEHSKKVVVALWSAGDLMVRERRGFQRIWDLPERVLPEAVVGAETPADEAMEILLERALSGHGWASTGTLASTWRLRNCRRDLQRALTSLVEQGRILACWLTVGSGRARRRFSGWIRPADLELADRLRRLRPRPDRGVLLSPFDPVLWDRQRTRLLFGFDLAIEIFKPAKQRRYGYYCLPVLAGDRLVARVDLKAERAAGRLRTLALHYEGKAEAPAAREAVRRAVERYASTLGLQADGD